MKKIQMILCGALFSSCTAFANNIETTAVNLNSTTQLSHDTCQSFASALQLANKGDAKAQYQIAMMYFNGDQVKTDQKLTQQWLLASAEQNNVQAQYRLATIAEMGLSGQKNTPEAFNWYLKAANLGYAKAQYKVADFYQTGIGVQQDQNLAHAWYEKAANKGNTLAQIALKK